MKLKMQQISKKCALLFLHLSYFFLLFLLFSHDFLFEVAVLDSLQPGMCLNLMSLFLFLSSKYVHEDPSSQSIESDEDEDEEEEILGTDDDEQEDPRDYCKGKGFIHRLAECQDCKGRFFYQSENILFEIFFFYKSYIFVSKQHQFLKTIPDEPQTPGYT